MPKERSAPLLAARGLRKQFGGLTAVAGVDLDVHAGEVVGLIGPNGAGKTTLFNLVPGALRPTAGRVRFDGADVTGASPAAICRRGMARTYQHARVFGELSVAENVEVAAAFGHAGRRPVRSTGELLDLVGLDGDPRRPAQALPLGERKRLQVARALAAGPRLLLLDEVVAGLDREAAETMLAVVHRVRAEGTAVLFVEHLVRVVLQLCDRIAVLDFGTKIFDGPPGALHDDPAVVDAYLGEQIALS